MNPDPKGFPGLAFTVLPKPLCQTGHWSTKETFKVSEIPGQLPANTDPKGFPGLAFTLLPKPLCQIRHWSTKETFRVSINTKGGTWKDIVEEYFQKKSN